MQNIRPAVAALLPVALLSAPAEAAPKPSFDCAKARAPIEIAICSDERLAARDAEMAELYRLNRGALAKAPDDEKTLKDEQRRWLGARLVACAIPAKGKWSGNAGDLACVTAMYTARIADLSMKLAQPAPTPLGACSTTAKTDTGATVSCSFALGKDIGQASLVLTLVGSSADIRLAVPGSPAGEQTVHLQEAELRLHDEPPAGIEFGDYDFDGYTDFSVVQFFPAGPNVPASYFLFDPANRRFIAHQGLSELASATFDERTRTVSSFWRGSAVHYGRDLWGWEGGKLVRILSADCDAGLDLKTALTVTIGGGEPVKRATPSHDACMSAAFWGE